MVVVPPRAFRSSVFLRGLYVVLGSLGVLAGVRSALQGEPTMLAVTLLGGWAAVRGCQVRVEAYDKGVRIVDWWSESRLRWSEVESVGADDEGLWLLLRSGGLVRPSAFRRYRTQLTLDHEPARAAAAGLRAAGQRCADSST